MQSLRGWLTKRYARWPMMFKVMVGSLITLIPPLLIIFVLGRQGWLYRASLEVTGAFLLVVLGVVLYLHHVSLRLLFQPLFQLMDTVSRLQKGDYRARAPYITGDRELAQVGGVLNQVLDNLDRSRKYTSSRTLQALERERRRIGRELHDETSQALTTLIINLEVAIDALSEKKVDGGETTDSLGSVRTRLVNTRDLTESTLEEIRKLIFDLRPSILDDLGLIPAMRWYAMNKLEPLGIDSRFDVQGSGERLPPDTETALFRIFQEALTNIIKHAEASLVVSAIKVSSDAVALEVIDDGVGFEPDDREDGSAYAGLGLFGMQERAKLLGGTFSVRSRPGVGTRISVEIPRPDAGERTVRRERS